MGLDDIIYGNRNRVPPEKIEKLKQLIKGIRVVCRATVKGVDIMEGTPNNLPYCISCAYNEDGNINDGCGERCKKKSEYISKSVFNFLRSFYDAQ